MKLNALKFALAGGIFCALIIALGTIASMLNIPGFPPFTKMMTDFYGPWGYSVSVPGLLIGALWGFLDGFWQLGVFALIYNRLIGK